jgi:hypothetical protein
MLQLANTATPAVAASGFVAHDTAAPAVPLPVVIVSAMEAEFPVLVFPNWSWAVTTGCCTNGAPAVALPLGSVVKISLLAAAAVTLKLLLVAPVRAPSLADSEKVPTLVGIKAENAAIDTVEVSDVSRFPN